MTEIVTRDVLLNVESGELLPVSPEAAAVVLGAARTMKRRLDGVIADATAYLAELSRSQGTKTFHTPEGAVSLTGGPTTDYDPLDLMEALREAGCPEERIEECVVPEVSYKVNRSVLRQLTGANEDYKAAAELAERTIEKPLRASVK